MANTYTNILKAGLQASYNALQTKDNNVLYFCTDTGKIYKGEVDFTNSVVVAASKPETPIVGKLYVLADTNTVEVFVGGAWKVVSYPTVTSIDVNSDDNHIATAAAVYNAIQDAIEDLSASEDTVKAIEAGSTEASIKITKGDDRRRIIRSARNECGTLYFSLHSYCGSWISTVILTEYRANNGAI